MASCCKTQSEIKSGDGVLTIALAGNPKQR